MTRCEVRPSTTAGPRPLTLPPSPLESGALSWRPNLTWITPALAVGGSFPAARAADLARDHGLHAIVDLRAETRDDETLLREHGLDFLHLPTLDLAGVAPSMLENGVAFANRRLDKGQRVLIHCEHGIGRSVTLALCVLVSRGAAPLAALEAVKSRRAIASPSPAQYESLCAWLAGFRAAGGAAETPDFDAFARIAYRHLGAPP